MLMAKSMEKMLRQTFSVFEPEQCLEMRNYKYSFNRIFKQMELVFYYYNFLFLLVHPEFWVCEYYRQMKKCVCHLIYDKANGYVARLELVGDSLRL